MGFAHSRGVLHRDLKPGNLFLVQRAGASGGVWLKVLDFGLAKAAGEQNMTAAGTTVGTPAYMAPEVLKGNAATPAADVYAIGLILYRMLAGRPAFEVPDVDSTPWAALGAVFQAHQAGIPSVATFAAVPPALATLVAQCLATDPAARPVDGQTLLGRLDAAVNPAALVVGTPASAPVASVPSASPPAAASTVVPVGAFRSGAGDPLGAIGSAAVNTTQARSPALPTAAPPISPGAPGPSGGGPSPNTKRAVVASVALAVVVALGFAFWPRKKADDPDKTPSLKAAGPLPAGMLLVGEGEFTMGSMDGETNEQPVRRVFISTFAIDRTEVTNAAYKECVDARKCVMPASADWSNPDLATYPITSVNWDQATAFCAHLGKRLPTEAEWEKAARGTDGRTYPWGVEFDASLVAYTSEEAPLEGPGPVGQYPGGQSPYGAIDMAGNVGEWVSDWYGPYDADAVRDPTGPADGQERIARGSHWATDSNGQRVALRSWASPVSTLPTLGFRCVKSM